MAVTLQGLSANLQGGSPDLQGSSPNLQPTSAPVGHLVIPVHAPAPTAQKAPATGAAPAGNTGGGGSQLNSPEYLQGIQQEYGGAIRGAQSQLENATPWFQRSLGDVGNIAGSQEETARQQAGSTLNTLNTQESGVQGQQRFSLAQLADMIHGQNVALGNQLGSVGAGSSSAVGQGQYALAREQNANRGSIQQQTGTEVGNIEAQKQATNDTLKTALDSVASWKQQQLDQITQNYQNTMAQLQQAITVAQGEEKARLAVYGQHITQAASSALGKLDAATSNAINTIHSQVSGKPTIPTQQTYTPQNPINIPQVSPFDVGGGGNTNAAPAGGSLDALKRNLQ